MSFITPQKACSFIRACLAPTAKPIVRASSALTLFALGILTALAAVRIGKRVGNCINIRWNNPPGSQNQNDDKKITNVYPNNLTSNDSTNGQPPIPHDNKQDNPIQNIISQSIQPEPQNNKTTTDAPKNNLTNAQPTIINNEPKILPQNITLQIITVSKPVENLEDMSLDQLRNQLRNKELVQYLQNKNIDGMSFEDLHDFLGDEGVVECLQINILEIKKTFKNYSSLQAIMNDAEDLLNSFSYLNTSNPKGFIQPLKFSSHWFVLLRYLVLNNTIHSFAYLPASKGKYVICFNEEGSKNAEPIIKRDQNRHLFSKSDILSLTKTFLPILNFVLDRPEDLGNGQRGCKRYYNHYSDGSTTHKNPDVKVFWDFSKVLKSSILDKLYKRTVEPSTGLSPMDLGDLQKNTPSFSIGGSNGDYPETYAIDILDQMLAAGLVNMFGYSVRGQGSILLQFREGDQFDTPHVSEPNGYPHWYKLFEGQIGKVEFEVDDKKRVIPTGKSMKILVKEKK